MEFSYTIIKEKTVNIDFKDIYIIQIDDFLNDGYFDPKNIDLAKDYLSDDFGDNIEDYLYRIGLDDFDEGNNENLSDYIWEEYSKWLDNNYNPSDFE